MEVENKIVTGVGTPQPGVEDHFPGSIELIAPTNIDEGVWAAIVSGNKFRSTWIGTDLQPLAMISQTPLNPSEGQVQHAVGLLHGFGDTGHYEPWVRHCVALQLCPTGPAEPAILHAPST